MKMKDVGMQACGDIMIGQHGRSVHEAIPHLCRATAIPTSLLVFYHHLEIISQSIQPTVERLSCILMTFLLVVTLTCQTDQSSRFTFLLFLAGLCYRL